MSTTPSPTPFHDLLARATKGPYTIDKDHPCFVEVCKTVLCAAPTATDAELIRRALAFFAAGGYDAIQDVAVEIAGCGDNRLLSLLRILDGEDAGPGENEAKQS